MKTIWIPATGALLMLCSVTSEAHKTHRHPIRPPAHHIIIPHSRVIPTVPDRTPVQVTGMDVSVDIIGQVATTTMDVTVHNPGNRAQDAEVLIPVPKKAVIRGFSFQGEGSESSAEMLPADEARRVYDAIVAKTKDPALLEFAGYNLIRSSVFPVEAGKNQKMRIIYENLLPADGNRIDYELPRSESHDATVPWSLNLRIRGKQPVSTVYSPTHEVWQQRDKPESIRVKADKKALAQSGPFKLSYLLEKNGVSASLFAYPDPAIGGGYFLMLAGTPVDTRQLHKQKRELTLVLDRSGSMNGEKIKQARESMKQVISGLNDGEAFNIIIYNEVVEEFSPRPVIKDGETEKAAHRFIDAVNPRGGTNIHDSLLESLRQKPMPEMLPIILYLTDGIPTIGNTSERAIRELVMKHNTHQRRVFTFGIGADVNTPLLDRISDASRAVPTYVLPGEDVEVKVGSVFRRLSGPVLSLPQIRYIRENGSDAIGRVKDVHPVALPDIFDGDQMIVLGQYIGEQPLHVELTGDFMGNQKTFRFDFDLAGASTKNSFVPRLWASRKIGVLVEGIRDAGADLPSNMRPEDNPKIKELIDEVVRLSREFGVLTEYTAFLAREGEDLQDADLIFEQAAENFHRKGWQVRSGQGAVSQSLNGYSKKSASTLSKDNAYFNDRMECIRVSRMKQVDDRTYVQQGQSWVDSRLLDTEKKASRSQDVSIGSQEFNQLVDRLQTLNRLGCLSLKGEIRVELEDIEYVIKR